MTTMPEKVNYSKWFGIKGKLECIQCSTHRNKHNTYVMMWKDICVRRSHTYTSTSIKANNNSWAFYFQFCFLDIRPFVRYGVDRSNSQMWNVLRVFFVFVCVFISTFPEIIQLRLHWPLGGPFEFPLNSFCIFSIRYFLFVNVNECTYECLRIDER